MSRLLSHPGRPRAVTILILLSLSGCGTGDGLSRVPVGGSVAVDGAPLKAGVVRFIPVGETKGPAAVATVTDGAFELSEQEGPVAGTHRVEIEALGYLDFALDDEQAYAARIKSGKPIPKNPIPERFNRRSELTVQLAVQGDRDLVFQLNTKGVR